MNLPSSLDEPLLANEEKSSTRSCILLLLFTIVLETTGTLLLKRSSEPLFMTAAFVFYFSGLFLFSFVLKHIPLFVAYTTWCALGTIGVSVSSSFLYEEVISPSKWACIVLIIPCVTGLYVLP